MHNSYCEKWILYISSYLPLYVLLMIKETNIIPEGEVDGYLGWITGQLKQGASFYICMGILICISLIDLHRLLMRKNFSQMKLKRFQINPESDSLMNYIITYFPPLLTLDIANNKSLVVNLFIFFMIGCIYVGSSATFLNPVLGILGYRIFAVEGLLHAHHIISKLTFDEIERAQIENRTVHSKRIGEGVLLIKQ